MTAQETEFQDQCLSIIAACKNEFPSLEPPPPVWLHQWLSRNSCQAILDAVRTLASHPAHVRARYSEESVGRAISALLRDRALRRAITNASNMAQGSRS